VLRRHRHDQRRGAALVEAALVYPVLWLLIIGVIVGGLGVVRHNQVALLAREGSRYASVRGAGYAKPLSEGGTGSTAATTTTIQDYVRGKAAGLDTTQVTVTTTWNTSNALTHTSGSSTIQNTVSVTVSYPWIPEAYFGGVTLTSTSVTTMSY